MVRLLSLIVLLLAPLLSHADAGSDIWDEVEHHYVDSDGVNIHYVTVGEGPVVLFVHGVPNWWYDWRHQMAALKDSYKVVAMDTRGYNDSDKPRGKENYEFPLLLNDVHAVIDDLGVETVSMVGHDWGAGISWRFAAFNADRVKNLIILNLTHPKGYMKVRETGTPEQLANMEYIERMYNSEEGSRPNTDPGPRAEAFARQWNLSDVDKERYRETFAKTYADGISNYYRGVYPMFGSGEYADIPTLEMPVLQFHGLEDVPVDKDGLRDTWNWVAEDYTLLALPGIGHNPHREVPELVNDTMRTWLDMRH